MQCDTNNTMIFKPFSAPVKAPDLFKVTVLRNHRVGYPNIANIWELY